MARITYQVVEHNGGFAYKVGDVYSETFGTHKAAHEAAESAARRQSLSGTDEHILYQDAEGQWQREFARGDAHPQGDVEDALPETEETRDPKGRPLAEGELPDPDRAPLSGNARRS